MSSELPGGKGIAYVPAESVFAVAAPPVTLTKARASGLPVLPSRTNPIAVRGCVPYSLTTNLASGTLARTESVDGKAPFIDVVRMSRRPTTVGMMHSPTLSV